VGDRTTLNALHRTLAALLQERLPALHPSAPVHEPVRPGDVRHSQSDIGKAQRLLGFAPTHDLRGGLHDALPWYIARFAPAAKAASGAG